MKFNYLIKYTTFFSTLLLIIFLAITNNKEYTKLRILIWNTPSLTVGNYIAISAGSGFLLSYFITTNLAKIHRSSPKAKLKIKDEHNYKENNEYEDTNTNLSYDKTLIERDINDPSPTINASFRIIRRRDKNNSNIVTDNNIQYDETFELENQYNEQSDIIETSRQVRSNANDWNDESFSSW